MVDALADLDLLGKFFEERIEIVELTNGGQAFIQRPKVVPEGSEISVSDLPDDFVDVRMKKYIVNVAFFEFTVEFESYNLATALSAAMITPIIRRRVLLGKASGNLKEGVYLKFSWRNLVVGDVSIKLEDKDAVLRWRFSMFGKTHEGQVVLFSI